MNSILAVFPPSRALRIRGEISLLVLRTGCLSVIIGLVYLEIYNLTHSSLQLIWSVNNMYRQIINQEASNYYIPHAICSTAVLKTRIESLNGISNLLKNAVCRVEVLSDPIISQNGTYTASYSTFCMKHRINWKFSSFLIFNPNNGCNTHKWKIEFEQMPFRHNIIQPITGIFFSVMFFFLNYDSTLISNAFVISFVYFIVLLDSVQIDPQILHTVSCIILSIMLFFLAFVLQFDFSAEPSPIAILSIIIIFPFLISLLTGISCPAFNSPAKAFFNGICMMFADFVFPALLELKVDRSLSSFIGIILVFIYIPLNVFGISEFVLILYDRIKTKMHNDKSKWPNPAKNIVDYASMPFK